MSVMSQSHSIIIYQGIIATGHGKEVVDSLNALCLWIRMVRIPNIQDTFQGECIF